MAIPPAAARRTAVACTSTSPAPRPVKAMVAAAVQDAAVPGARRYDLEHSMRTTLGWQLGVFFLALLLVARLPRVKPGAGAEMPGGA